MSARKGAVVVGIDGSDSARLAVEWAANAAMKRKEPLLLVSTYAIPQFLYAEGMLPPQELFDDLERETREKIDDAESIARRIAPDLRMSFEIREGSAIDLLLELSRDAAMIVMGSRGLGGLSGMVMGSVSASVVSHAHCPVVVVREDNHLTDDNRYGPIVVGVDGSPVSEQATAVAFREAAARDAELVAVHTWMDMQVQASLAGLSAAEEQWSVIEEEQQQVLAERLSGYATEYPDVKVTRIVTRDRPVRALVEAAANAQLLVVGSHGRGGFKGMLLGSTSRALLQSSPCPLMVVRPQE